MVDERSSDEPSVITVPGIGAECSAARIIVVADDADGRTEFAEAARAVGIEAIELLGGDGAALAHFAEVAASAVRGDRIVLDADVDADPGLVVTALRRAASAGVPVVVARRRPAVPAPEIRPGVERRRAVEAALSAQGASVVETPVAALALAALSDPDTPTRPLTIAVTAARERDAARLVERLAPHLGEIQTTAAGADSDVDLLIDVSPIERADDGRRHRLRRGNVEVRLADAEDVRDVLTALHERAERCRRPVGIPVEVGPDLAIVVERLPRRSLDMVDAADLAVAAGIPCLPFVVAGTGSDAVARAADLGFPLVAKAVATPGDAAPTEAAAVYGIGRLKDLRRAVSSFHRAGGEGFAGAVLQPEVAPIVGFDLGSFHDPAWGPFLHFAATGAFAGTGRTAVLPAPVTRAAARALVDELTVARLVETTAVGASEAIVEVIVAVGRLAAALGGALPDFLLMPLALLADGTAVALDVRATLAEVPGPTGDRPPGRLRSSPGRRASFPPTEPLLRHAASGVLRRM